MDRRRHGDGARPCGGGGPIVLRCWCVVNSYCVDERGYFAYTYDSGQGLQLLFPITSYGYPLPSAATPCRPMVTLLSISGQVCATLLHYILTELSRCFRHSKFFANHHHHLGTRTSRTLPHPPDVLPPDSRKNIVIRARTCISPSFICFYYPGHHILIIRTQPPSISIEHERLMNACQKSIHYSSHLPCEGGAHARFSNADHEHHNTARVQKISVEAVQQLPRDRSRRSA